MENNSLSQSLLELLNAIISNPFETISNLGVLTNSKKILDIIKIM